MLSGGLGWVKGSTSLGSQGALGVARRGREKVVCDGTDLGKPPESKLVLCFRGLTQCGNWAFECDRLGGELDLHPGSPLLSLDLE